MQVHLLAVVLALTSLVPSDVAEDVGAGDRVCADETCMRFPCTYPTPHPLVPGACPRSACDPATQCFANATRHDGCQLNATIDGRTCQAGADAWLRAGGRGVPVPGAPRVGATEAGAHAALTDGFVHDRDLENDWASEEAGAEATVAGVEAGAVHVALYRTVIRTEDGHEFTHVAFAVQRSGPDGGGEVLVGAILLDGSPDDCVARASGAEARCSDAQPPALP